MWSVCAKTAEPIKMPFGGLLWAGPAERVGKADTGLERHSVFCTIKIKCGYILHDLFFAHCLSAFVTIKSQKNKYKLCLAKNALHFRLYAF